MKLFKKSHYIFLSIFALSILVVTSCNKKKDTTAKIFVYDTNNARVAGAQVVLYGEPSSAAQNNNGNVVVFDTVVSNNAGEALFNYNDVYQQGQAGVAVLNIKATIDSRQGVGVIKIEEEKENTAKVFVQ